MKNGKTLKAWSFFVPYILFGLICLYITVNKIDRRTEKRNERDKIEKEICEKSIDPKGCNFLK